MEISADFVHSLVGYHSQTESRTKSLHVLMRRCFRFGGFIVVFIFGFEFRRLLR